MNKGVRRVSMLFILALVGYVIQYALNIYLAKRMGISLYGLYNIAIKLLGILVSLALFGTDVGSQCFLSKYLQSNNQLTALHYIQWNMKLVSVSFLFSRLLAFISFTIVLALHFFGVQDIERAPIIVFILWVTPFAASFKLLSNYLLSNDIVFSTMILSNIVLYIVQFLLFYVFFNLFKYHPNYLIITIVLCCSNIILFIIAIHFLDKNITNMIYLGLKSISITPMIKSIWFDRSSKLIINNILYLMVCSLDLFIIKFFAKDPLDVGHYAAILTITSLIWIVPANLYQTIKPIMANALTTKQGRDELQTRLNVVNKIVLIILSIMCLFIIIFSNQLLGLFGSSYIQGQTTLIILTIGSWYGALNQISGVMLLYGDFEGLAVSISLYEVIFILLVTIPATYWFGIIGTAIATSTIIIINEVVCVIFVKRKLGINCMLIPGYFKSKTSTPSL